MKTTATTTAVAAVLFAFTACGDAAPVPNAGPAETPEVAAALDWIEAADMEFGAAPFSPPGWPYRIGDRIYGDTSVHLHKRFPDFFSIKAVTWVDGLAFGAAYNLNHPGPGAVYEGHFPMKVDRELFDFLDAGPLPPEASPALVFGDRDEADVYRAVIDSLGVLRTRWHEPWEALRKDGTR